jgi:tRNA U34 5-methylaminomethyl-2-thiouridine-forming methyltransferase MnmC
MNDCELILTADGSHTLRNKALNEHYHSTHGAIQESSHVFIKMGLDECSKTKDSLSILEIGFGTGLNAYLSLLKSKGKNSISYTGVETFPLSLEDASCLNYSKMLLNKDSDALFLLLHSSPWNKPISITNNFILTKIDQRINELELKSSYDLIYFDAFSPAVQPDLWTTAIFEKLFAGLHPGGMLVTYCAKGEVKRSLRKVGFKVEGRPGPPGKREITVAFK